MTCSDDVAIVTGATGKGIGRSTALTLAREGAKVVVNYRTSGESADAIVAHIKRRGSNAVAIRADVFDQEGCRELVDAAIEQFGQVDICVVSPGAGWHPEPIDALDTKAALQDLHQEIAPLYYLMRLLLPGMYDRRHGRIIGIAVHPTNLPPAYAYNTAKAARARALLLAQDQAWSHDVTVNVIAPGPVPAIETLEEAIEQCGHGPAWQKRSSASPQDIAEGIAFLCSEAGRFITGCELPYLFTR